MRLSWETEALWSSSTEEYDVMACGVQCTVLLQIPNVMWMTYEFKERKFWFYGSPLLLKMRGFGIYMKTFFIVVYISPPCEEGKIKLQEKANPHNLTISF